MPTRVFYNTSPYGFKQQQTTHTPQSQPQTPLNYFNTNMYDHMAPQMQQQRQSIHAYMPASYPNHHYSHQNQYIDPNHSYRYNNASQTQYYQDQYQQQQHLNIPFQNNPGFYQNSLHAYQLAMIQAQYYNAMQNQYLNNKMTTAYNNVNYVPPVIVQPPTNTTNTTRIETIKPNKEVYHKIPEFKTIRKRLPAESRPRSQREKPKLGLERMRSQSAMASIGGMPDKKTKNENRMSHLTKINELNEIKKKMEKLEEISAKDTEEKKKLKLDLLRKLRNKKNYENFNIYINELPFIEEGKANKLKNTKGQHSDESGLGDIDKNSSSSKCSQSDSSDSSANPEPPISTTPSNPKKIIPIINHKNKPVLPQIKSLAYKPPISSNEIVQERKYNKSKMNTDLVKPETAPVGQQELSKLVIKQKFKFLGVFNANPEEYILQYGSELIPSIFNDKKSVG